MDGMVGSRIAIIPARGGSKRLPGKNILDVGGKPMIAWTIEAAIGSGMFDRVLVSTDDTQIADVATSAGADVPFLRQTAFDDHSAVSVATLSALDQAESYYERTFDTVIQLMANCPFRGVTEIVDAVSAFDSLSREFQISCFEFGWMNPWWAVKLSSDGKPERIFEKALASRSQDLPPLYCPTGAIWIAERDALQAAKTFYGPGHKFHPMDWLPALDIDSHEDLKMARLLRTCKSQG